MAATKTTRSRRASASKSSRTTKKSPAKTGRTTAKRATKTARKTAAKSTRRVQSVAKKSAGSARKTAQRATTAARTAAPATRKATGAPGNRANGRTDAIALLKQDHREVEAMFSRFEKAGKSAIRRKEQLRDQIIEALSVHAAIEELVFYPAVREEVRRADSSVLEALEEHHIVKVLLHECEGMDPTDERFTAKMTVMMENVRHHVKEEERDLFPQVRKVMSRARLLELGDGLQQAKQSAPTRPHPNSPDEPPGNALVGGAVAVVDRARNTGKRAVRRVRSEIPLL